MRTLAGLCRSLRRKGLRVKVESNGRRLPRELDAVVDLWSVSPKWDGRRPGPGARTAAMDFDERVLARLVERHAPTGLQLKFVVTYQGPLPRAADMARCADILAGLPPAARRTPVFLIPEAYAAGDYLQRCRALERMASEWTRSGGPLEGFDVRVQPQWHRVLYGDERGR